MAKIETYFAPFPSVAQTSVEIRKDTWGLAIQAFQVRDPQGVMRFEGRFPDGEVPTQPGGDVTHQDVGNHVGSCVARYNQICQAAGLTRVVVAAAWTVYYRYLDAYKGYLVGQYLLRLSDATGERDWTFTLQQTETPPAPARDFDFQILAVVRVEWPL